MEKSTKIILAISSIFILGGGFSVWYFMYYKPNKEKVSKSNKKIDDEKNENQDVFVDLSKVKTKVKSLNLFRSEINMSDISQTRALNKEESKLKQELEPQGIKLIFDPKKSNWSGFSYKGIITLV